jgi:hypothetical protein
VIGGSAFQPLSGDELTTAARQDQKNTTSQDQARQSSTNNGAGDAHAVEDEGRVELWRRGATTNNVSADPQPIGLDTSITVISCPALKIGETGGKGVPGGMIGFGAESQKKSPFDNSTCGTKK